jgi:hypothetical protein
VESAPQFQIGDRVSRTIAWDENHRRYGTVVQIVKTTPNVHGQFEWLYLVDWDDHRPGPPYLANGLRLEVARV